MLTRRTSIFSFEKKSKVSMSELKNIPVPEKSTELSLPRIRTAMRAIFTGTTIGLTAGLSSQEPGTALAIGGYLALRRVVGQYLEEKPLWLSAAVEIGLAVPPLVILDSVLQQMEQMQPAFELLAQMYSTIHVPDFLVESIRNLPELLQTAPELAVYLLFFFLFTEGTWVRLAKMGLNNLPVKKQE
jgi:hypothetical protein